MFYTFLAYKLLHGNAVVSSAIFEKIQNKQAFLSETDKKTCLVYVLFYNEILDRLQIVWRTKRVNAITERFITVLNVNTQRIKNLC